MGSNENVTKLLRELVYRVGILQTSIYQHMLKEEEQVNVCYYSVREQLPITSFVLSLFNFLDIMHRCD